MTGEQKIAELFDRARQAYAAGRAEESFALGKDMDRLAPADPRTWIVLGQAALRLGDHREAARCLMLLLNDDPANLDLRRALTQALVEIGYFEEAAAVYRPVFEKTPESVEALTYFGNLASLAGLADEAASLFAKAAKLAPGNPDILAAYAWAEVQQGKFGDAEKTAGKVLANDPGHPRALAILAELAPKALSENQIAALKSGMDDPSAHPGQRVDTAFAHAKAVRAKGDAEETFAAFEKANALARDFFAARGGVYDDDRERRNFEAIKGFFTKDMLGKKRDFQKAAVTPVFIIGLPRSGTTLVEQILASHPQIFGGGELKLLGELYLRLEDMAARNPGLASEDILEQMAPEWRAEFQAKLTDIGGAGHAFVTDKMPLNYPYAGMARALFPEAKFIFLKRDAMDNCLSMYFQPLTDSYPASVDLGDLGRYYRRFEAYLDHWRTVLGGGWADLKYEDLVSDQEGETRNLIDFLGLPWDEACLKFYENTRPVRTLSNVQVRRPISNQGVGRWKRYEGRLGPLKKGLGLKED